MLAQVRRRIALAGFTLLLGVPAFAQQPPAAPPASPPAAPAPAPAPQGTDNDPIVATVEGRLIRFSTVGQASDLQIGRAHV